jgi:hypothetical protein
MSITERIRKASANIKVKDIKEKGYIRVAQPEKVASKIKKYTGFEVEISEGNMLTLK